MPGCGRPTRAMQVVLPLLALAACGRRPLPAPDAGGSSRDGSGSAGDAPPAGRGNVLVDGCPRPVLEPPVEVLRRPTTIVLQAAWLRDRWILGFRDLGPGSADDSTLRSYDVAGRPIGQRRISDRVGFPLGFAAAPDRLGVLFDGEEIAVVDAELRSLAPLTRPERVREPKRIAWDGVGFVVRGLRGERGLGVALGSLDDLGRLLADDLLAAADAGAGARPTRWEAACSCTSSTSAAAVISSSLATVRRPWGRRPRWRRAVTRWACSTLVASARWS